MHHPSRGWPPDPPLISVSNFQIYWPVVLSDKIKVDTPLYRYTHVSIPISIQKKLLLGRHLKCGIIGIKSLLELLQNSDVLQFKDRHQDKPRMSSGEVNAKTIMYLSRTTWSLHTPLKVDYILPLCQGVNRVVP